MFLVIEINQHEYHCLDYSKCQISDAFLKMIDTLIELCLAGVSFRFDNFKGEFKFVVKWSIEIDNQYESK